jgi:glycosyltransferase involved in cell wall biosynthesis
VTGFVDDVRPYLDKAFLYVCPIRDGGGTKLKVLDALAMKKVLISHPIACEGIDVTDGESVVFAETADEYIEQIKNLFNDRERAAAIASNGYEVVASKYDFIKVGERLCAAYENL